jgi:hypothetical protein
MDQAYIEQHKLWLEDHRRIWREIRRTKKLSTWHKFRGRYRRLSWNGFWEYGTIFDVLRAD